MTDVDTDSRIELGPPQWSGFAQLLNKYTHHLSARDVQSITGISHSTIAAMRSGRYRPRQSTVERLAMKLTIESAPLLRLLNYIPDEKGFRSSQSIINEQIRSNEELLIEEEQQQISDILDSETGAFHGIAIPDGYYEEDPLIRRVAADAAIEVYKGVVDAFRKAGKISPGLRYALGKFRYLTPPEENVPPSNTPQPDFITKTSDGTTVVAEAKSSRNAKDSSASP